MDSNKQALVDLDRLVKDLENQSSSQEKAGDLLLSAIGDPFAGVNFNPCKSIEQKTGALPELTLTNSTDCSLLALTSSALPAVPKESRVPHVGVVIATTSLALYLFRNSHPALTIFGTAGGSVVGGLMVAAHDKFK